MLSVTQQVGFGSGRRALTYTHRGAGPAFSTGSGGVSSFGSSGHSIGAAASDRIVIVRAGARGFSGASRTITGVTFSGAAADGSIASGSSTNPSIIAWKLVPAGATVDIVVTASGDLSRGQLDVATITGALSVTPNDTDQTTGTGTSASRMVDIIGGGVALYVVSTAVVAANTWAGATEEVDTSPGTTMQFSTASLQLLSTASNTATASWSGSGAYSICAASWR